MRTAFGYLKNREWDKLQSLWVLPAARRLYLLGALVAVFVAALALAVALFFQIVSIGSASVSAVPDAPAVDVKPIDPASLDALFKGPQSISLVPIAVVRPVVEGTPVARFAAETPWGMAATDGFQLVGGRNMAMFREAADPERGGSTVLVATAALAQSFERLPPSSSRSPVAEVRVLGKDANGNLSQPVTLKFHIVFVQPTVAKDTVGDSQEASSVEDLSAPEELRRVVVALAQLAGQSGTDEYFEAYNLARDEPARCGAADNVQFNAAYVAAFDRLHRSLTRDNVGTFYRGLCEAWEQKLQAAQLDSARQESLRAAIIEQNTVALLANELRKGGARAMRDVAIGFAVAAVGFFMLVALFLAFLAIEGHSNALRQALEKLARERTGDAT